MCKLLKHLFKQKPAVPPVQTEPPLVIATGGPVAPRGRITAVLTYDQDGFHIPCKGAKVVTGVADTDSMLPTFDVGHHLLCLTEFDRAGLAPGDIVVYSLDGGDGICHRIHAISNGLLQFKGDNNGVPDEGWYGPEVVKAVVVGIIYSRRDTP